MRILKYDIEKVTGIPWKKKKSYRYLYRLACREDVIKKAFKRMRKGKTKRKDFQMAEENLDAWVKKIQEIILNTKPDGWQTDPQKRFKPVKHNPVIIKEFGKTRVVYVPTMVELWIQHVIVMILEPIIAGSSYPMSSMAKYKKDVTIWLLFWMAISGRFSGFGGFPESSVSAPRERIYRSNS